MENVRRALAVSMLARGWAALIGLMVVPVYVRFLGIEAYGVVGFFTSIQALITFFDLGLGATLIRELSRLAGNREQLPYVRDLTCTFETTYFLVAGMICLGLFFLAPPIAHHWLQVDALPPEEISRALALGAFTLALQWPAGLYGSGLAGLQRQTQLGMATALFATLRAALTLGALALQPGLESFFWGQIIGALLQSWSMRILVWRNLSLPAHRPVPRPQLLKSTLGFAGGMTGITLTSIVLTQMDKMILSHSLSLAEFGIYSLSSTFAFGLYVLVGPMFTVMYPRFTALLHRGDEVAVADAYHASSQLMALLVIPLAATIAAFSQHVLYTWTGDAAVSERGAMVLALLISGNAFNGIMNMPYALQLASGWVSLTLWVNLGAIMLMLPAVWWFALHYGAIGGAAVWFALNLGYIMLTPQFMHRRLLPGNKGRWYGYAVALPLMVSAFVMLLVHWIDMEGWGRTFGGLILVSVWLLTAGVVLLTLPALRMRLKRKWQSRRGTVE